MNIRINIEDNAIAVTDESLARLNELLKTCEVIDRYSNDDKVKEGKRIRLAAKMVVKASEYTV